MEIDDNVFLMCFCVLPAPSPPHPKPEKTKKKIAGMKAAAKRRYTYKCPKCESPIGLATKLKPKELSATSEWYRMAACRNALCRWRGYARQLHCFFCHRLPKGCVCTGAEMFRFDHAPQGSRSQDFDLDRPKLTYFLLCPGPCNGRLGFPIKPQLCNIARYQVTCGESKVLCSSPDASENQWKFRVMQAPHDICHKPLKDCECKAPYSKEDLPLHTKKGALWRALYRTKKKREGLWFCGRCFEVVDISLVSEREWEKLKQQQRLAPNCPKCARLSQKVPASELECPECMQIIYSSVFDGRVHQHVNPQGRLCTYQFRFRGGTAYNPGNTAWLQKCMSCEEEFTKDHFNKSQLRGQRTYERKCKSCAAEAKDAATRAAPDKVKCKFFEDGCANRIDISEKDAKQKDNLRSGHK